MSRIARARADGNLLINLASRSWRFACIVRRKGDNVPKYRKLNGLVVLVMAGISSVQAYGRENSARIYRETGPALSNAEALENYTLASLNRIYFATGKCDLSRDEKTSLGNLVKRLGLTSQSVVELRGYADGAGSPQQNLALSMARAEAIARFLRKSGVPSPRVRVIGLGEIDPDGPALQPEHQRVDLRVFLEPAEDLGVNGAAGTEPAPFKNSSSNNNK